MNKKARRWLTFPDTYEKLVAMLMREHPDWSKQHTERYIAEELAKQEAQRAAAD